MVCENCGNFIDADDDFCSQCGVAIRHEFEDAVDTASLAGERTDHAKESKSSRVWPWLLEAMAGLFNGLGLSVSKLVSGAIQLIVFGIIGIWGYGAVCAIKDVSEKKPMGLIIRRMYGTEYNPLTRHGYRMFIKHFASPGKPEKNNSEDDFARRAKNALKETCEDVESFMKRDKMSEREKTLLKLREWAADEAGRLATEGGKASPSY